MKIPNFQARLYQTAQKTYTHSLILIFQLNSDEAYLVFSHIFSVIWCLDNNFRFRQIVIYILMSQHFNGFISKSNDWPLNKQVQCDSKNQSSLLLLCYIWIDRTGLWYGKQNWERCVFNLFLQKFKNLNSDWWNGKMYHFYLHKHIYVKCTFPSCSSWKFIYCI